MTLRLRLTLFYTLLVALILGLSGVALHVFLQRSLLSGVDESLEEAAKLVAAVTENVDGAPQLLNADEVGAQFSNDLVAVLYTSDGAVAAQFGNVPTGLPVLANKHSTWGQWRTLTLPLDTGTLTVLRALADTNKVLRRFDLLFLILAPAAVLVALALGYALAGGALAPVKRLTGVAYDLAERRAWRERLPEPERRDELWHLARATNTLLSALGSVIESERRFTADAAHELRTPLTVLQGRLEKGREQVGDPARVSAAFDTALEANHSLLTLIEKLLALARAESGQNLPKERVALDEIAFDVAAQLQPAFTEQGLELVLDLPEEPIYVTGDRTALELAVRNLLDNAGKFTARGTVLLRVEAVQSRVCLHVSDTGPGIPAAALPHLFERFYQSDVRHRQQGSGLGLALVQSIAAWHGGEVTVENLQSGARFTLTLPRLL